MPKVLVTGATGFIAGHVVKELLESGHQVVGTSRTLDKAATLGEAFPKAQESGQLVFETLSDVRNTEEIEEIFKKHQDISVVMHTASPFFFNSNDVVNDLLQPAIEGTRAVFKAILSEGKNVTKVVLTSSIAAMVNSSRIEDPSFVVDEKCWNPITWNEAVESGDGELAYVASKTFAEKEAWDFMKKNSPGFTLATINPSVVFGPHVHNPDPKALNTSNTLIDTLALDTKPGTPPAPFGFAWVDVRDVAKAHVLAIDSKLDNQRLLLCAGKFAAQDLLDIINSGFPNIKGCIAYGNPGTGKEVSSKMFNFDNAKTRELLGLDWIGLKQSIEDFVFQYEKVVGKFKNHSSL